MRLLVPCGAMHLAGGLLRFERVGRVLRRWGHELAFATPEGGGGERREDRWSSALPLLSFAEAGEARWDAVMVPGGGHGEAMIAALPVFRDARFGLRVQHFLNGPARKPAYLRVTAPFDPDLVVVNNQHWCEAELAAFGPRPVRTLVGAVDTALFAPPASHPPRSARRRLGAIANKNPEALLCALRRLGEDWELHWFGRPSLPLLGANHDLVAQGRLVAHGLLLGEALAAYYHGLDAFCSAETHAGWCNPAAEAMASGVPLVATRHGTLAFAEHGLTALVLDAPDGAAIAEAVRALAADPDAAGQRARRGRGAIRDMTWESYAAALLGLIAAAA